MSECIIIHRRRRVALTPAHPADILPARETGHSVLSRPCEAPPPAPAPPEKPRHGRKEKERRARARRRAMRLQRLYDHWPALFSVTRPLKVGIRDDLVRDAQVRQLEVSGEAIGQGLREWVRRHAYLKALIEGDGRYDMQGECVAPLSEEHRQLAREMLNRMDRAGEARRQPENPAGHAGD